VATIKEILDRASFRSQPAAVPAEPGAIDIQNIGGLKQVDDQGNATALGGGTVLTDGVTIIGVGSSGDKIRANPPAALAPDFAGYFKALFQQKTGLSPLAFFSYAEDFVYQATFQPSDYSAFPSGGSTAAWNLTSGSGVMTLTHAAGAGQCDWSTSVRTAGPYATISNTRTKRWMIAYRVACHAAPQASSMVSIGLADNTSFLGLGYVNAATNWQYVRGTDGAIANITDTGKAIDATGNSYLWMYIYNDGTNIKMCIDVVGAAAEVTAEAASAIPAGTGYGYLYMRGPVADKLEFDAVVFCGER